MAADVEKLRAMVVLPPKAGKPIGAASQDGGRHCNCLHIGHCRRAAVEAHVGGERWLQPRLALQRQRSNTSYYCCSEGGCKGREEGVHA